MTGASTDHPQVFLAFDFGESRIGVAVGNSLTASAQPVSIIAASDNKTRFETIGQLIRQWEPHALVLGIPRHPDGAAHAMTERCERFARQLEGRFALRVHCVDERYSSVEAASRIDRRMDPRRTRDRVDDVAACIILEQFFSQQIYPL